MIALLIGSLLFLVAWAAAHDDDAAVVPAAVCAAGALSNPWLWVWVGAAVLFTARALRGRITVRLGVVIAATLAVVGSPWLLPHDEYAAAGSLLIALFAHARWTGYRSIKPALGAVLAAGAGWLVGAALVGFMPGLVPPAWPRLLPPAGVAAGLGVAVLIRFSDRKPKQEAAAAEKSYIALALLGGAAYGSFLLLGAELHRIDPAWAWLDFLVVALFALAQPLREAKGIQLKPRSTVRGGDVYEFPEVGEVGDQK